jgi:hypothetical protein
MAVNTITAAQLRGKGILNGFIVPAGGSIITSNLVLNLDAANPSSYPGTGTTWTDISGNGNNATLINGTSYDSSNSGVMLLDGVNDYIQVPNSSLFQNNTNMSLSIWVNFSSIPVNTMSLMNKGPQDSSLNRNYFWLHYSNSGTPSTQKLWWEGGSGTSGTDFFQLTYNWVPSLNAWYNITTTFEPNLVKIYLNGSLVANTATTVNFIGANNALYPFSIGSYRGSISYFFPGKLNLPLFYQKTLSASEVSQNYNAVKSRYGL